MILKPMLSTPSTSASTSPRSRAGTTSTTPRLLHQVLWRVAMAHVAIVALWAWGLNAAAVVMLLTIITSVLSYMVGARRPIARPTTPPPRMFRG